MWRNLNVQHVGSVVTTEVTLVELRPWWKVFSPEASSMKFRGLVCPNGGTIPRVCVCVCYLFISNSI